MGLAPDVSMISSRRTRCASNYRTCRYLPPPAYMREPGSASLLVAGDLGATGFLAPEVSMIVPGALGVPRTIGHADIFPPPRVHARARFRVASGRWRPRG